MQTTILNNGTKVLAKHDGSALQYTNRKQAAATASRLGGSLYQASLSRAFYVRPPEFQPEGETEQQRFERWALGKGMNLEKAHDCEYVFLPAFYSWLGWSSKTA